MQKQSILRQLVKEEIANMTSTNNGWKITAMNIVETILDDSTEELHEDNFGITIGIDHQKIGNISGKIINTLEQKGYLRDMGDNSSPFGENLNDQKNPIDCIKLDIPLFIRLLEYAREDSNSDIDLHNVAESAISLSVTGKTLSMEDYPNIIPQSISESEEDELDDDTIDKQASNAAKSGGKQYSTVNKAVKGLKQLEKEMKELASKYKAAEGKEKESIKSQLKDKTAQKKKIEVYIDKQTLEDDED